MQAAKQIICSTNIIWNSVYNKPHANGSRRLILCRNEPQLRKTIDQQNCGTDAHPSI